MAELAVSVLWFLVGVVLLCGVVWLAIYVLKMFVPTLPPRFEQVVWVVVLLLILIYLISIFAGGGGAIRLPR